MILVMAGLSFLGLHLLEEMFKKHEKKPWNYRSNHTLRHV